MWGPSNQALGARLGAKRKPRYRGAWQPHILRGGVEEGKAQALEACIGAAISRHSLQRKERVAFVWRVRNDSGPRGKPALLRGKAYPGLIPSIEAKVGDATKIARPLGVRRRGRGSGPSRRASQMGAI